jgi:adenylylsulfate kinase
VTEDRGFCVWFTGLSGAGKSTIAELLVPALRGRGHKVELLDGDVVRTHLSKGLGFSKEDRDTNILRIGFVADLLVRNGVVAVCSAISPYREIRDRNRELIGDFVEVYVKASLEEVTRRDVKGLYGKAIAGEISNFTGVSDPYEEPESPELVIDTERCSPQEAAEMVITKLEELGLLKSNQPANA